MQSHYNTLAGEEVGRIAALSDGIFAIAATILVLDFHTPEAADIHSEAELLRALTASAPRLLPWLLSSLTLGIFWLGQQTQLSQLAVRIATSLGCISFFSRSSPCCRSRPGCWPISSRTARPFSSIGSTSLFSAHASTPHGRMPSGLGSIGTTRAARSRARSSGALSWQSLYAIGALAGLVNVTLGITLIMLIQLNYAIGPRLPILSRL